MNEVKLYEEVLGEYCRHNHIVKLSLFGSVLRDDFRPDSDVDVLVEFEDGHTPGMFGIALMEGNSRRCSGGRWTCGLPRT